MGQIYLEIQIKPSMFNALFQMLDIPSSLNFLLGHPWIHNAGAIPSSLHQKIKFIVNEKQVTIYGEEDHRIYNEITIPYIKLEHKEEDSYHAFELVITIHYSLDMPLPISQVSNASLMVTKVMVGNGFVPGMGLDNEGQGILASIEANR